MAATCLASLLPHVSMAAALPEPQLQVSKILHPPQVPFSETERSLLRLENRSGLSRLAEVDVIRDMMGHLDRMATTVRDLNRTIAAIPTEPCKPAAPICPAASESVTASFGDLPWLPLAGGAVVLALLALMWRQRSRNGKAEAPATPVTGSTTKKPAAAGRETRVHKPHSPNGRPTLPPPPPPPDRKPRPAVRSIPAKAQPAPTSGSPAAPRPAVSLPESSAPPKPAATLPELSGPPTLVPTEMLQPVDDSIANADLAIELADVMLSMGLASGAAQTLEEHIRQHPRQALVHWLKLLDVYRRSGQQSDYENAAKELQQHFNIAAPNWETIADPAIKAPGLENYLHINHRIQELWPRKSCTDYLTRLLEDNRGGTRTGFPQQVIEEVLLLLAILRG